MRRGLLVLVLALCGCTSSVTGSGSRADSGAVQEAAGYTADGDIPGVTALDGQSTAHTDLEVDYAESPPFGGEHDPSWADCTGTVYPETIRSENAVHALEHGAVWVAYSPDLGSGDLVTLRALVDGVDYTLMSPYPGLDAAVSVQSWGRQLKLDSADDPRLEAFVRIYRQHPDLTPELGATCSNPDFGDLP